LQETIMTMLATAPVSGGTAWMADAVCYGHTAVFFAPPGERPEAREVREAKARSICNTCPVRSPCRKWARDNREYGFWGGESEEERAAAGFRVEMPVGRIARYPRGEGKPVQARPDRSTRQRLAAAG
jgi:WhiB family redox-sensing transcriptional regulator